MVEIELAAKAVEKTVNKAEHISKEATAETCTQDVSEQVAQETERSLKHVTKTAVHVGSKGLSKVSGSVSNWGSATKSNDITEDIDI